MLAGEGQVQNWIKIVNWESPEKALEFQLSQPPTLLYDQACTTAKRYILTFWGLLSKLVSWNKIQACTQKPAKYVQDYYSRLQIVFKQNSGLPIDTESTKVAFNLMLTDHLNILVKRTQ